MSCEFRGGSELEARSFGPLSKSLVGITATATRERKFHVKMSYETTGFESSLLGFESSDISQSYIATSRANFT